MIELGIGIKLRGFILWTILLISLCFSAAAKAFTSQVFNSFRNNEYSRLEGVSAYLIKSYVQGAYGELAKQCPDISVPTIPDQLETARYMMMPHRQGDVGAGFFSLGEVVRARNFIEVTANPKSDIDSWMKEVGCTSPRHEQLLKNMERLTNDDNYAGPIQEKLQTACIRNEGSPQIRVCECVTLALDMQTSPAQRKKMMEGEVIRTILKEDETLSARVWYKCKGHLNLNFKIKSR